MRSLRLGPEDLEAARRLLTGDAGTLGAVSVGTPHMSIAEIRRLAGLSTGSQAQIPFYVNTSRSTLEEAEAEGTASILSEFGVTFVTDTCTYIAPIIAEVAGTVMTDSAKWAHYAPANLGVEVVFASLEECVRSAVEGHLAVGK